MPQVSKLVGCFQFCLVHVDLGRMVRFMSWLVKHLFFSLTSSPKSCEALHGYLLM